MDCLVVSTIMLSLRILSCISLQAFVKFNIQSLVSKVDGLTSETKMLVFSEANFCFKKKLLI